MTTVSAATTSPESWDFAPAEPLTAVFERLPLTTMPLERPAPRLAAPRPSSSRFGVDLVVVPRRVGLRGAEALREADQHDADGGGARGRGSRCASTSGSPNDGSPLVDVADDRDAVLVEVEQLDRGDPEQHGDERARARPARLSFRPRTSGERGDADEQRQPARVAELAEQVPELLEEVALALLDAEQLGQLPDDDRQRQADDEALQHRLGDEVRQEAEPQQPGDERERPRSSIASVTVSARNASVPAGDEVGRRPPPTAPRSPTSAP